MSQATWEETTSGVRQHRTELGGAAGVTAHAQGHPVHSRAEDRARAVQERGQLGGQIRARRVLGQPVDLVVQEPEQSGNSLAGSGHRSALRHDESRPGGQQVDDLRAQREHLLVEPYAHRTGAADPLQWVSPERSQFFLTFLIGLTYAT
ncbi:hypothetical protein ACGFY9_29515 [Streptomyces sp. NPDC048504]|uniref:hypothetical protein n=1 Tax=Streptomyces sp. NPDC048504 TaxID=3365559 RepID=UPI00371A1F54